jgi:hypothetical protein
MKLSSVTTFMQSKAIKVLAAATLAVAVLAPAPAARAQHFAVGVQIGGPRFVAPPPVFYGPGYYGYRRFDDRAGFVRRDEFFRHDRDHRFYGREGFLR